MDEAYIHLSARVDQGRLSELSAFLCGPASQAATKGGGTLWGCWLGMGSIGWPDDELIVMIAQGDLSDAGGATEWLTDGFDGITNVETRLLVATSRPTVPATLQPGGVIAHRWFDLDAGDVDEVVELSSGAWPAFESAYDATIEGLFRSQSGPAALLLVTRYASLAEWERSRQVRKADPPGADNGDLADSARRFRRRHQLTRRQVVRIAPLVG
ncbi:MAG: hypothetical protein NVS3B21_25190 [Acidimicrobiales bacterium]